MGSDGEVATELRERLHGKDLRRMLQPVIVGALRDCIQAHGPITHRWLQSAAKRINTQIRSRLKSERCNRDEAAIHQARSVRSDD